MELRERKCPDSPGLLFHVLLVPSVNLRCYFIPIYQGETSMFRAASSSGDLLRRHRGCCSSGCSVKVQTFGAMCRSNPGISLVLSRDFSRYCTEFCGISLALKSSSCVNSQVTCTSRAKRRTQELATNSLVHRNRGNLMVPSAKADSFRNHIFDT